MTMNVSLTPELETLVNEKVKSGDYNSASEVVREALRLLKEQDELRSIRREEVRREVMKGVEDYLANKGCDTRLIQDYLGHRNITHTVRYTQTAAHRFEGLWR